MISDAVFREFPAKMSEICRPYLAAGFGRFRVEPDKTGHRNTASMKSSDPAGFLADRLTWELLTYISSFLVFSKRSLSCYSSVVFPSHHVFFQIFLVCPSSLRYIKLPFRKLKT